MHRAADDGIDGAGDTSRSYYPFKSYPIRRFIDIERRRMKSALKILELELLRLSRAFTGFRVGFRAGQGLGQGPGLGFGFIISCLLGYLTQVWPLQPDLQLPTISSHLPVVSYPCPLCRLVGGPVACSHRVLDT